MTEQFGRDVKTPRRFKQDFTEDLRQICAAFPKLKLGLDERGLMLYPAASPEQLFIPSK